MPYVKQATTFIISLLFLGGCALDYAGYSMEGADDIKIVKTGTPDPAKFQSKKLTEDFDKQQDGTKLILDFLASAKEKGALYVSDISITINSKQDNRLMSCITDIVPTDKLETKTESVYTAAKHEGKYVYKPVTKWVTESEYKCKYVSKPVQKMETYTTTEYDYYTKRSKPVTKTRYVTRYESKQECGTEPVRKMVTRYEYQYESQYVPPQLDYITKYYTTWDLKESEPACNDIDSIAPNSISGNIYIPVMS